MDIKTKDIKIEEILNNKQIKISYRTLANEITSDSGMFYNRDNNFIIITLNNGKLKWVPLTSIVRIEEI